MYSAYLQARWEYLTESETTSLCPYKGVANCKLPAINLLSILLRYDIDYNVFVNGKEYKDLVWWYKYPTAESAPIAGHMCFYNEKVDIYLDGEKEEK